MKKSMRLVLGAGSLLLLILMLLFPVAYRSIAQLNPTQQRQTLNAIINPRLTATARINLARTATLLSQQLQTQAFFLTETQAALTATATPSHTPTITPSQLPTNTLLPTLTLTATSTPSATPTLSETQIFETIVFEVGQSLTQTAVVAAGLTATAGYRETFNAILWATLGITATPTQAPTETPSPTPLISPTPLNPTDQFKTLIADIDRRLTATAAAQATLSFQRTIDAIIAGTLQITPTPTITPLPSATPTLSARDMQQTAEGRVNLSLTGTAAAIQAQTGTAAFQETVNAVVNQGRTATADAVRGALRANRQPLSPENAAQITELTQIAAHNTAITALAFNSVGNQFVSAAADNRVRLWDTLSGWNLFTWDGLTDRTSVALSPDGNYLAAGSSDGTVRLWDLTTRADRGVLSGHSGAVRAVAFSPDSRFIASASADRSVRLWDARSGALVRLLGNNRNYQAAATSLDFSADGLLLAVGSEDAQIHLWEVSSGVLINRIRDLHRTAQIMLSPDAKLVATVGNSNSVVVWTISEQPTRVLLREGFAVLTSLTFDPSGKLIAAGSQNGMLMVWQLEGERLLFSVPAYTNQAVSALAFSPEGTHLISGGANGIIRMWGVRPTP
jgi:WD40 repeat protein